MYIHVIEDDLQLVGGQGIISSWYSYYCAMYFGVENHAQR